MFYYLRFLFSLQHKGLETEAGLKNKQKTNCQLINNTNINKQV
jgi:hypothetical protein